MKIKNEKLAGAFMKFMTDEMGVTFIDATPDKKPKHKKATKQNYLPEIKK